MKSLKKSLLTILVVFLAIVLFFGFTEQRLVYLFLFPILALSLFLFLYLYRQNQLDDEKRIIKSAAYAIEDKEAEVWIKKTLVPDTLQLIKAKRWPVIFYSILLFLIIFFLWSYLSYGLLVAIRDLSYAGALLGIFVIYTLLMPHVFAFLHRFVPKRLKRLINGDWERGYIFLLPITFILYILYPFLAFNEQILAKITTFPLFFVIYSSLFLCIYCITYMYQDIHKEEEKEIKAEIKETLKEK